GELTPAIVELDDAAARAIVQRLADEVLLLVERALRDLALDDADVVLGGGMFSSRGPFFERVAAALPVEPFVPELPPVAGAVLGCPGGRSLLTTYRHLPELPETTIVMMDEYVPVPPTSAHYSCRGFAERELPRARAVWLPDPDDPAAFDERIAAAGGIDLFLL